MGSAKTKEYHCFKREGTTLNNMEKDDIVTSGFLSVNSETGFL